jgi:hypothetical protein
MSTRNLPGSKGWPTHEADNLTTTCEPIVQKMQEPRLTILWAFAAYCRDTFFFYPKYSESFSVILLIKWTMYIEVLLMLEQFYSQKLLIGLLIVSLSNQSWSATVQITVFLPPQEMGVFHCLSSSVLDTVFPCTWTEFAMCCIAFFMPNKGSVCFSYLK